ncbi:unnamed protein product, partial [marine sediment metagenome]
FLCILPLFNDDYIKLIKKICVLLIKIIERDLIFTFNQ